MSCGTRYTYLNGCRCDACRHANAVYQAEWRAARQPPGTEIQDIARREEDRLRRAQYRPGYQVTERTAAVYDIDIAPIPAGHDMTWRADAACNGADLDLFFPDRGNHGLEAKRICARCPVLTDCLEFALVTRATGIWGGMTDNERRQLVRAR